MLSRMKETLLCFSLYACYSWELALNTDLDLPSDNMYNWKGIREKAVEVKSEKVCATNEKIFG